MVNAGYGLLAGMAIGQELLDRIMECFGSEAVRGWPIVLHTLLSMEKYLRGRECSTPVTSRRAFAQII